jgi:hypothetical protein
MNRKQQRIRKAPAPSAADASVDDREMPRRCGDPFDEGLDFCGEASGKFRLAGAVPIARRRPTARSEPVSKLALKLVPRNAVFPILIETCDALVELGSLGVCHRYVLVLQTLPERPDQVEPLARREPSQLGCQISHTAQGGDRKSPCQLGFRPTTTV